MSETIQFTFGEPAQFNNRKLVTPYGSGGGSRLLSIGKVCGPVLAVGGSNDELGFSYTAGTPFPWTLGAILGSQYVLSKTGDTPWSWQVMGRGAQYWECTPSDASAWSYDQAWTWYFRGNTTATVWSGTYPYMRLRVYEDIPMVGWTEIFTLTKQLTSTGGTNYSTIETPTTGGITYSGGDLRGVVYSGWFASTPS